LDPSDSWIVPDPDQAPAMPAKGTDCANSWLEAKKTNKDGRKSWRIEKVSMK
jgi:hypothetical protein